MDIQKDVSDKLYYIGEGKVSLFSFFFFFVHWKENFFGFIFFVQSWEGQRQAGGWNRLTAFLPFFFVSHLFSLSLFLSPIITIRPASSHIPSSFSIYLDTYLGR